MVYDRSMKNTDICDVIVLGIAVMDITASPADRSVFDRDNTDMADILLATGGDAANQAVLLAKLGRRVSLCARVGADAMGGFFLSEMSAQGVDISRVAASPDSDTGVSIVLVSPDGQRCFLCKRGNNGDFCAEDIDFPRIAKTRALSIASLFALPGLERDGLLQILQAAKSGGVLTFADTMVRRAGAKLDDIRHFLPYIDYFLPSETECALLTGGRRGRAAAALFLEAGAGNVVIKQGADGASAYCADFSGHVPAFGIDAKDTTGSGDAFCAGFIHRKLAGAPTKDAVLYACACGAMSALYAGAAAAPVSEAAINGFIKTYRET